MGSSDPAREVRRIGDEVASRWADDVDREGRFPHETFEALRASSALGALIPVDLGGAGASVTDTAGAVTALSQHCASSGLILAMHHIQVGMLVRHGTTDAIRALLGRTARGDVLIASANSEAGLGGERRVSSCALEPIEGGFHLDKHASTVSYGEYADAVLATARRDASSAAHDQVMAVCLNPKIELTPNGEWDTMGLRGTCSRPGHLVADVPRDLVLFDYVEAFTRTSLPLSAILLSAVWAGCAEAAARRAHSSVRARARKALDDPGAVPALASVRLAELGVMLYQLRLVLSGGTQCYEVLQNTPEVETLHFANQMNYLKVATSELAVDIARRAASICGLPGYMNSTDTTLARIVRDVSAAPLMVNNDRALQAVGQTLLVQREL